MRRARHVLLPCEDHRADHGDLLARKIGHRAEAAQRAAGKQVHHKGLSRVVHMVAQRQLVRADLPAHIVQYAPAHPGAKRTGVGFFSRFKYNAVQLRAADHVFHAHIGAQRFNGRKVRGFPEKAGINADCLQRIRYGVVALHFVQGRQQGKAVLAAGNAHRHRIARDDHIVFFHCRPHAAHEFLHGAPFCGMLKLKFILSLKTARIYTSRSSLPWRRYARRPLRRFRFLPARFRAATPPAPFLCRAGSP